ncbi:MAG: hypothetical protein HZB23_03525 [Deltaproteobacteria bacterium]|nr:hypothetical protein [Deltaproteobacteria bacterium]
MKRTIGFWALAAALAFSAGLALAGWNEQGAWKGQARSRSVAIQIDGPPTAATVGNNKAAFTVPGWMDGWRILDADLRVYDLGLGTGTLDVTVTRRTGASDATMYSATVATGYTRWHGTLTEANERVTAGDIVSVNVTRIHSTASKGLWITLNFLP